jgi:uncharacterized membrane protein YkgB
MNILSHVETSTRKSRIFVIRDEIRNTARSRGSTLLRWSLAVVFFWFGALKIANVSPVVDLLQRSFSTLAVSPYIQLLGLLEVLVAIGLVFQRSSKYAAALMVAHLLGTLGVVVMAPAVVFAPSFPVLTMTGEFIMKNIVLITAGFAVMGTTRHGMFVVEREGDLADRRRSPARSERDPRISRIA